MQITRTQLLVGLVALIALLAGLWTWTNPATAPTTSEPQAEEAETNVDVETRAALVQETSPEPTIALSKVTLPVGTATLVVDGSSFALTAPAGATLEEALDRLEAESGFTYEKRTYAGLGAFVTHIQGRAGTGEYVWILYVNGEQSSTGISATRIRSGDVIEWKLEKSY